MTYPNGTRFEGEFRSGNPRQGTLMNPDGTRSEDVFFRFRRKRRVRRKAPGVRFEIRPDGGGVFMYPDGTRIQPAEKPG